MRPALALLPVVLAMACVTSPVTEEAAKAPLGDDRLRPVGRPIALVSGQPLTGQALRHSVVRVDLSFDISGINVGAYVPRDFWAEVGGYLVDAPPGADVAVTLTGPRMQVLVRRIGDATSTILMGNEIRFNAGVGGQHLVMTIPSEIKPGSDHVTYDIVANVTPTSPVVPLGPVPLPMATWTCDPAYQGTGDGCDCGCGIPDPDCANEGCSQPGCSAPACSYCYDASGSDIGCTPAEW